MNTCATCRHWIRDRTETYASGLGGCLALTELIVVDEQPDPMETHAEFFCGFWGLLSKQQLDVPYTHRRVANVAGLPRPNNQWRKSS